MNNSFPTVLLAGELGDWNFAHNVSKDLFISPNAALVAKL